MLTFLFDLDGVIYRDLDPMPGAVRTVAALREAGHRVLFATNNATRTRAQFAEKLGLVGVPATVEEVGTSAYATARYLRTLPTPARTALVLGADALADELREAGIRQVAEGERPDCVVVGLDRAFTYERLAAAQAAILAGAALIATNRDPQLPISGGRVQPGAGSIVAAVEAASGRPATAIGKPGPLLYRILLAAHGADILRTIVVGDSLITDIPAAAAMELPSVLVLTGVSRRADLATASVRPTLVIETLPELLTTDLEALLRRPA